MRRPNPKIIDLDHRELAAIEQRAEVKQFLDDDYPIIRLVFASYNELLQLVKNKDISLARLRKMLFGASTEKTEAVIGKDADATDVAPTDEAEQELTQQDQQQQQDKQPKQPKGHGRNGADDYPGAQKIPVPHETLQAGDACPDYPDCTGTVYVMARPGVLIRIVGQVPLQATVYQLEKLRCNLCGKIFAAQAPEDVGAKKYDATAGSMIALLKYGNGLPFNRLRRLQANCGIPLPAATQWDIVHAKAKLIAAAFDELIRQAAQGEVLHNDDTNNKILQFMGERAKKAALKEESQVDVHEESQEGCAGTDTKDNERTGIFTTGIVSTRNGRQMAIFLTGRKHAGENLRDLLAQRARELERPIQMCDALSRNMPADLETILANCLAHGRRNFVDVVNEFPEESRYVLQALKVIYHNDAETRQQKLSPEERLEFHQMHSRSTMDELHKWLTRQFEERLVEPNSGLGQAISYMLKHWNKLTLFLHKAGAPLDNNIANGR